MPIEPRQLSILQALVTSEEQLHAEARASEWILLMMGGGRTGLKPGIPNEPSLNVTHGDLLDLVGEGYLHELSYGGSTVVMKFTLTAAGRAAGRSRPVAQEIGPNAPSPEPSPGEDQVLAWLVALESSAGAAAMANGTLLLNQAIADFDVEHGESIARRIVDLRDQDFVNFDDPSANIDQISESQRLSSGSDFRITAAGRDRVRDLQRPSGDPKVTQIIHAINAQVAAGDIQNFVTFQTFLDQAEETIDTLDGIDDVAREEAKSLISKLRGATGTVATGAASGAGGTVLGTVFKKLLGLE